MKDIEFSKKQSTLTAKSTQPVTHTYQSMTQSLGKEKLQLMKTDELIKILTSPDMNLAVNAVLRQRIITVLQEREGNIFVERLLEKESNKESK